jgi:hypothetical protein
MTLREQIAAIVRQACENHSEQFAYTRYADAILSIPEIRDALELVRWMAAKGQADLKAQRDFIGNRQPTVD